ncbi:outer membrane protein OmpA-like peptidoglycan-associated protein [Lutibacter sp. Hel_I_33_5]|uniref:OmpA family protein n=1 Tax=Lutibacter sp. Hel_I_33_5 TaxID=1566289 RepID=UPI0011A91429|nr:OmpA family protein [Lutibacter sp. Hel_I_33_5]TVZ56725.1 outer membrane protein OmpA-like peptidoglycan-associated protein [Lutibacter sp. Hel_I_33_5]
MRRIILLLCISFFTLHSFGQFRTDEITYRKTINLKNTNTWAVGGGFSNFIMHGDLRSIGTGNLGSFYNFGGYLYVNKMFNPLLGLEFKVNYNKIAGGAQYFSEVYEILYVDKSKVLENNMFFNGRAYGAELNLIFSFSNLYDSGVSEKWHAAGYFGVGYHQYNSALFEKDIINGGPDIPLVDFGFNRTRNSQNEASSIYLSAQFGLKRRISKRVDIEFRTGMYFNYEDHLDAAISNKQDWETFFLNQLGVTVKLGKSKIFSIWGDEDETQNREAEDAFEVIDTDEDGVIDQLDKEPATPPGVLVYANGVSIDSDGDGVPDYKDDCRFEPGLKDNKGCPFVGDRDKDGVSDRDDKCPDVKGLARYQGCPDSDALKITGYVEMKEYVKDIYFNTASNRIRSEYYYTLLDEVAEIMLKNSDVTFSVYGYTDNRGEVAYNQKLSEKRAKEARAYLIARGVDESRIISRGLGELSPKYGNDTKEGRQLNRRVEIRSVNPFKQKTRVILEEE